MATVPTTRTFVAGEIVIASYFNDYGRDVDNWLLAPAICKARQTSLQTLTTAVNTAILLDAEDVDSTGMHSTVTNTSRLTAVYPGWYWLGGGVTFVGNATGLRLVRWSVNAAIVNDGDALWPGSTVSTNRYPARGTMVYLNVGDYLEIFGTQTSGGNLATAVSAGEQSSTSAHWISN